MVVIDNGELAAFRADASEGIGADVVLIEIITDHLHASPKEFISKLIAVTSWLDAVVTYTNVLHPMEN